MAGMIDFTGNPTQFKLGESTELVAEASFENVKIEYGSGAQSFDDGNWTTYIGTVNVTSDYIDVGGSTGDNLAYLSNYTPTDNMFIESEYEILSGSQGYITLSFLLSLDKSIQLNLNQPRIDSNIPTLIMYAYYNGSYADTFDLGITLNAGDTIYTKLSIHSGLAEVEWRVTGTQVASGVATVSFPTELLSSTVVAAFNYGYYVYTVARLKVLKIGDLPIYSWLSNGNPIGDGNPLTYTPTSVGVEDITLNVDDGTTVHTLTKPDYLTVVSGLNTSIVYNGDTIYFDLTKNIEATLSLPYIKMVDSLDNIGYRKFSDNSTISASWPINCMVDRVESEVFGAYLGAYRWENYGVRLLLDPYNYTLQDYSVDNNTRIDFDFDTGLADRETFSSEKGLSFRLGAPPSPVSVQFIYDVTSTANKVVVYYGGASPLETPYRSEWANGANVSGYIDFSGTTVNINIVITGGGTTETLTLVDGTTSYSSSESLIFYNAGNESGTEARIYSLKINGVHVIRAVAQLLLDEYISGQNYDPTGSQPILTTLSNTFPLSPLYDTSSGQGVTLELDNEGHRDFYGNITGYSLMVTPAGSLTDADFTGQTTCTAEDWELNGVKLPFPSSGKFRPNINGSNRVTQSYGGYTDTVGTERVHGDVVDVEVECDVIKACELLKMLRDTDWSLGAVSARFAESYKPFGWRHNSLVVKVQLVDTRITSIQTGPQKVRIKFGLQYQGV